MTDEETIKAVTSKLVGELYVGQRVARKTDGREGVIEHLALGYAGDVPFANYVYVRWSGLARSAGDTTILYPGEITPL